jgi:hypothetical protein
MPFINVGKSLDDVPEESAVPEGDYDLSIVSVGEPYTSEKGRTVIKVNLRVDDPDYPDAKLVLHAMAFPNENDWNNEPRTAKLMLRNVKRFLKVFGVNWDDAGFDSEELLGATGRCRLIQDIYEGETNNKLQLPRSS